MLLERAKDRIDDVLVRPVPALHVNVRFLIGSAALVREALQSRLAIAVAQLRPRIAPAGPFYYAEGPHQQYLDKVPNGYCGLPDTGVACQVPVLGGSS